MDTPKYHLSWCCDLFLLMAIIYHNFMDPPMKLCPFFDGHVLHMSGIPSRHRSIHHDFMAIFYSVPIPPLWNQAISETTNYSWFVVYLPPWNIWKSVGIIIPIYYGKIKNVWNHQPAIPLVLYARCKTLFLGLDLPIFVTVIINAHGLYTHVTNSTTMFYVC